MVDQTKNPHRCSESYSNRRQDPDLRSWDNFLDPLFELLCPLLLLESPSYLATNERKLMMIKTHRVFWAGSLHLYWQKNTGKYFFKLQNIILTGTCDIVWRRTPRKVKIMENNIQTSISFTYAVWGSESLIPVKLSHDVCKMRFDFIKPLQCCQDQEDGEVDFNDHVDVLLRKYNDSLAAMRLYLCFNNQHI